MLIRVLAFLLLLSPCQATKGLKVGRIFVNTQYNAAIIFEYAFASIPEGSILEDKAVSCFVSELKATGLFPDVQVELEQTGDGQTVDVNITPVWIPAPETYVIDELVLEDFTGIDEGMLRLMLSKKGLNPGVSLMRYPLSEIEAMVKDAAQEKFRGNPRKELEVNEKLHHLSSRVKVVAPGRVKVTIKPGRKQLCQ
jgi:outer membrane protein assembly factor BamA